MSFIQNKSATTVESQTDWSDGWRAMQEGEGFAYSSTLDADLELSGFDFSELPTSVTIDGIEATVDGSYDDSGPGGGNLRFRVYLSWDDGSSWTAAYSTTPDLTTSEVRHRVGGHEDDWSHSWTRAELQAGTLQVRVRTTGTVIDDPVWELERVTLTVYFTSTDTLSLDLTESLSFSEEGFFRSKSALAVQEENVGFSDKAEFTAQIQFAGDAEDKLESDSTLAQSLDMFVGEAQDLAAWLVGPGWQVQIGTGSKLSAETGYQSGIIEGEASFDGRFGEPSEVPNASFTIMRKSYYDIGSGTYRTIEDLLRDEGPTYVLLRVLIRDNTGAARFYNLFDGYVSTHELREASVRFELRLGGFFPADESKQVPARKVSRGLLTYGEKEGDFPEAWDGAPIPFGYGRFNIAAYQIDDLSSACTTIRRGAHFASLWGLKVPALPLAQIADRYLLPDAESDTTFLDVQVPQALFAQGSINSFDAGAVQIEVRCGTHTSSGTVGLYDFEHALLAGVLNYYNHRYSSIISWNAQLNSAVVYGLEVGENHGISDGAADKKWWQVAGCGDLRSYAGFTGWTTGTGAGKITPIFMNQDEPSYNPDVVHGPRWTGLLGFVALPHSGPSANPDDPFNNQGPFTDFGTGDPLPSPLNGVEVVRRVLNPDPNTGLEFDIQGLGNIRPHLCVQCPAVGPNLGTIAMINAGYMASSQTSVGYSDYDPDQLYMVCRVAPFQAGVTERRIFNQTSGGIGMYEGLVTFIDLGGPPGSWPYGATYWRRAAAAGEQNYTEDPTFWTQPIQQVTDAPFILTPKREGETSGDFGFLAPWQFQYMTNYWVTNEGFTQQAYAWDALAVAREPGGGAVPLLYTWFEVGFRVKLGLSVSVRPAHSTQLIMEGGSSGFWGAALGVVSGGVSGFFAGGVWGAVAGAVTGGIGGYNPSDGVARTVNIPYTGNIIDPPPSALGMTAFFMHGDGPQDDASGTYTVDSEPDIDTWSGRAVVERPTDIVHHMGAHFLGSFPMATSTNFGSFTTARTELTSAYRMVVPVYQFTSLQTVWDRIGSQCHSFIQRQMTDAGTSEVRFFTDVPDPEASDSERMYRSDGYLFNWDRIVPDSLSVDFTSKDDVCSRFVLYYGHHLPSGEFVFAKYCDKNETNFTSDAATYKSACATAETDYLTEKLITWRAGDIWDHDAAEAELKYRMNRRRQQTMVVEFDTFMNAVDLRPGHVIKLSNDIASDSKNVNGLECPSKLGISTDWEDHQLNVHHVSIRKNGDEPFVVHVVASEVYEEAGS